MILANSLVDGFIGSNLMGQGIVLLQILCSVAMLTAIIGKWREIRFLAMVNRRFQGDWSNSGDVLEYYVRRRPTICSGAEFIYKETCERLFKLMTPDVRSLLVGNKTDGDGAAALSQREIELVRGTCELSLTEETLKAEHGMGVITAVVATAPMLGLLGTVWGVLDAFAEMGSAGSANLATIAPSISAALVTTVVGLLVALPGVVACTYMNSQIRVIESGMEGFADELMGRIACEFQGKVS